LPRKTFISIWDITTHMGRDGRKHIYIGQEREEWVEESHINLSSLVREAIDEHRD